MSAVSPTLRGTSVVTGAVASRGTRDTLAYDLYLQGRYLFARRDAASLSRAISAYGGAIARDPGFARAYAAMGQVYAVFPVYSDTVDESDVYSLGSVLYEMLTGNAPFTGANAQQIIMKIITEPAEAVTKYRKSVPANIAAAVAKSLEKLPADRFETARAVADALHDARFTVASMASTARTTGAAGWRAWLREPRTIGALVVIAALTALAGLRENGKAASASMGTVCLSVIGPKDTNIVSVAEIARWRSRGDRCGAQLDRRSAGAVERGQEMSGARVASTGCGDDSCQYDCVW